MNINLEISELNLEQTEIVSGGGCPGIAAVGLFIGAVGVGVAIGEALWG